jgi:BCD family chlorophyll transporter-like MFS transporter
VVLTTSTLNRLMVVELALPAMLPGLLVALHYGIQHAPALGLQIRHRRASRTRWIIGGMAMLALGRAVGGRGVCWIETATSPGHAVSISPMRHRRWASARRAPRFWRCWPPRGAPRRPPPPRSPG